MPQRYVAPSAPPIVLAPHSEGAPRPPRDTSLAE